MTNNKFKMNKKGTVANNPLEDLLIAAKNEDLEGVVSALMAIDDEQFDKIEAGIRNSFEKTFSSIAYRNQLSQRLELMSDIDYQQELEGYKGIQETINELEISDNKKEFLKFLFDNAYNSLSEYHKDPSEHITVVYKKLAPEAIVPTYAHTGDAGADLYALTDNRITVPAGSTMLIPTGIAIKIPGGYEAQVRPRSGMSLKSKIRIANAPGTIDCNYRGEIGIIVDNCGNAPFIIQKGDKIAQLVFNKVPTADFIEGEVEVEEENSRGDKGFGSSGTNVAEKANE